MHVPSFCLTSDGPGVGRRLVGAHDPCRREATASRIDLRRQRLLLLLLLPGVAGVDLAILRRRPPSHTPRLLLFLLPRLAGGVALFRGCVVRGRFAPSSGDAGRGGRGGGDRGRRGCDDDGGGAGLLAEGGGNGDLRRPRCRRLRDRPRLAAPQHCGGRRGGSGGGGRAVAGARGGHHRHQGKGGVGGEKVNFSRSQLSENVNKETLPQQGGSAYGMPTSRWTSTCGASRSGKNHGAPSLKVWGDSVVEFGEHFFSKIVRPRRGHGPREKTGPATTAAAIAESSLKVQCGTSSNNQQITHTGLSLAPSSIPLYRSLRAQTYQPRHSKASAFTFHPKTTIKMSRTSPPAASNTLVSPAYSSPSPCNLRQSCALDSSSE